MRTVIAAGECDIVTGRRRLHLVEPRLYADINQRAIPRAHRWILHLAGINVFLEMKVA